MRSVVQTSDPTRLVGHGVSLHMTLADCGALLRHLCDLEGLQEGTPLFELRAALRCLRDQFLGEVSP